MKKLLAIILSVLMVVSSMTCLFTSPASAASAASASVSVAGANLLADLSPDDFTNVDGNANTVDTAQITVGEETVDAIRFKAASQKFYFVVNLTAGVEYTFNYSLQGNVKIEGFRAYKLSEDNGTNNPTSGAEGLLVNGWTGATSITTAKSYTHTFTPNETTDYLFKFVFNTKTDSEGENYSYFYNYTLKEVKEYAATATADGNGTANVSVDKGVTGTEVTFTAVAAENNKFVGWYNGDDKVSDDATYTTTIGDADLNLTAKFVRTYSITATADGNGTATASAATATEGTEVTFTAQPLMVSHS